MPDKWTVAVPPSQVLALVPPGGLVSSLDLMKYKNGFGLGFASINLTVGPQTKSLTSGP
jgi:hypothetical protein